MTGKQLLMFGWDFEPSVIVGCAALLLGYAATLGFRMPRRACYFVAGIAVLLLLLFLRLTRSPILTSSAHTCCNTFSSF